MARAQKGIRKFRGTQWRASVRVNGKLYQKLFALDTPTDTMKTSIENTRKDNRGTVPSTESLQADVDSYLSRITALRTYKEKKFDLNLWAQALGPSKSRKTITTKQIEEVLQEWLQSPVTQQGRKTTQLKHVQTIRKRKHNLQRMFTVLDGEDAVNPVKGCARLQLRRPKQLEVREIDYATIERILDAMPTYRRSRTKVLSLAKIRATVIAYTGIPPHLMKQIEARDLSLYSDPPTVDLQGRTKGEGVEARTVPLTPEGVDAFKAFHAANAYGPFEESGVNRAFKSAAKRVGVLRRVHAYDLRHSFGSMLYRAFGDLAAVAFVMMHAKGSTVTPRYTLGAHADVAASAVLAFSSKVAEQRRGALKPTPPPAQVVAKNKRRQAKATHLRLAQTAQRRRA